MKKFFWAVVLLVGCSGVGGDVTATCAPSDIEPVGSWSKVASKGLDGPLQLKDERGWLATPALAPDAYFVQVYAPDYAAAIGSLDPLTKQWSRYSDVPSDYAILDTRTRQASAFAASSEYIVLITAEGHGWLLTRTTRTWKTISPPDGFTYRELPSLRFVGDSLIMWGGESADSLGNLDFRDGYLLDLETLKWRHVDAPPSLRDLANGAIVSTPSDFMGVHRGGDVEAVDADHVATLATWQAPGSYEQHNVIAVYSIGTDSWVEIEETSNSPPEGWGASLAVIGESLFLGGVSHDLWKYSLSKKSWQRIKAPPWAGTASMVKVGERLAFRGPCDFATLYNPRGDIFEPLSTTGSALTDPEGATVGVLGAVGNHLIEFMLADHYFFYQDVYVFSK